jgi:integrase
VQHLLAVAGVPVKGRVRHGHAVLNCIVHIGAYTGLRIGEILALKIENVDLGDRPFIRVRHNLTRLQEIKPPKTPAGLRDIPIPVHLADMLRAFVGIPNKDGLLFTISNGGKMNYANFITDKWVPLLIRAGLAKSRKGKHYHFHALRHFAASWMLASGMPWTDMAQLMGHKNVDMTLKRYAHPVLDHDARRKVMDKMAASQGPLASPDATGLLQEPVRP